LTTKINLQIVVITADEKTICVNKTLSTDISAFQKSFPLDELKKAIDVAESKYYLQ